MKKKLTPAEIVDKFGIEPLVLSDFGVITAENADAAIKAFRERMLTTAVQNALGSDRYTVKIESRE